MGENEHPHAEALPPTGKEKISDDRLKTIDQNDLRCSRLSEAIQSGDYKTLEEILNNDPQMIKARYDFKFERWTRELEGVTPLIQAAAYPNCVLLELLLQKGADANEKTTFDGSSPIHVAARYGLWENYKLLLTSGAKAESQADGQVTILHQAAFGGDIRICDSALNLNGISVNDTCTDNFTLLSLAAHRGHKSVTDVIVHHKANVFIIKETYGQTALHIAAKNGNLEIVERLLSHSELDINMATNAGNTALHFAAGSGNAKVVELLLAYNSRMEEKRVNRNAVTNCGMTAIYLAALHGHTTVFDRLMLDQEVDLTISDSLGLTVLFAIIFGHSNESLFRVLKTPTYFPDEPLKTKLCCSSWRECLHVGRRLRLLLGEDEIGRQDMECILFWAVLNGELELLEEGLKHERLDLVSFLKGSKVPLHVAARIGNLGVIRILVEKGANVDFLATHNSTPIQVAAEHGHVDAVEMLLDMQIQTPSDDPYSYPKQLQRIIRKDSNGESAISLAVSRQHKSVEEFLWTKFKLYGSHLLTSSRPQEEKEEILEIAAKYERPGEERVLKYFLQQSKKPPDGWTALHWAVFKSQPVAVWWLLSKGGYVGTKILKEVRKLEGATPNSSDEIIQRLLRDPPPVLPTVANNNDDELVQEPPRENDNDIECQGTIVEFYDSGRYTEMHVSHKSVKDIIYQRGIKSLMEESRKQNHHNLDFVKKYVQECQGIGTAGQSIQQTCPDEPDGLDLFRCKAEDLAIDPVTTKMIGDADFLKDRKFLGAAKFRWIHIPRNDVSDISQD